MTSNENSWDAIIVGAGLGGLSSAATLAAKGLKVLVLERHTMVGGYATQFTRKTGDGIEYHMDLSLQSIGGFRENGPMKAFFEGIGMFDALDVKYLDHFSSVKFPDFEFTIPSDISRFKEKLVELAPEEKEGIEKLFDAMKQLDEEVSSLRQTPPGEISPAVIASKYPLHAKYMTATCDDFLADYVQDPKIVAVMSHLTSFFCQPPNKISALVYMSVIYEIASRGTEYIQGGGYALSRALRDCVLKNNGEVLVGNEVVRILTENGKCTGVRTKKGEVFKASTIVCNAAPPVAFDQLIDNDIVDPEYLNQIKSMEVSGSTIVGLFGVRGTPAEIGFDKDLTVVGSYDLNAEFDGLMAGAYEHGQFFLTNNTVVNPGDTPEGRSYLQLLMNCDGKQWCGLDPEVYKEKKAKLTEILIDRVSELIPDIRERLEIVVVATPKTHERYTLNPNGAVSGYSQTSTAHTIFRPRPDTPVEGLYLAGAWTTFGPGYIPSMLGGANTARMILEKN